MSYLLKGFLPLLALGTACLALGQNPAAPADSSQTATRCPGISPAPSVRQLSIRHAGPSADESALADDSVGSQPSTDAPEHLRLSIHTASTPVNAEAQGQFCRRERPSQGALQTAAPPASNKQISGIGQPHAKSPLAALSEPAPRHRPSVIAQAEQPRPPGLEVPAAPASQSSSPLPVVAVANGKITIHANGEPLAEVLEAVHGATGIAISMPPEGEPEPVFMNHGPMPLRDALVALVDGSRYNYMIMGSAADPERVSKVILSIRSKPAAASAAAAEAAPVMQPTLYGGQGFRADADEDAADPAVPNEPTQPAAIPSSVPAGINIQQMAAQQNKSPGQVLDDLQKQQLQVLDQQAAAAAAASQSQSPPR